MNENNSQAAKVAGGIVMTAIVMIGIYFFILHSKPSPASASTFSATPAEMLSGTSSSDDGNTSSAATTPKTTTKTSTPVASSIPGNGFKDGSYSAVSSYQVPGGQNAIKVSLTVKNDIITSLSTQDSYSDHESAGYISSFKNGLSDQVVGKRIDNINLSRFNGASDTSDGFDQALLQIIGQAKTS